MDGRVETLAVPLDPAALLPDAPRELLAAWAAADGPAAQAEALLDLTRHAYGGSLRRAHDLAHAALKLAVQAGSADVTVRALLMLAFARTQLGQQSQALEDVGRALALIGTHGLEVRRSQALNARAVARRFLGDRIGALADLRAARHAAQAQGQERLHAIAGLNLAALHIDSGRPEVGLHQLSVVEAQMAGRPELTALQPLLLENRADAYVHLARLAQRRGRPEAADELVAQGLKVVAACRSALLTGPDIHLESLCRVHAARLLLLAGDTETAAVHAHAALALSVQGGQVGYPQPHLALAEVQSARGDHAGALEHYGRARAAVHGQGRHQEMQDILHDMAQLHEACGDLPAALSCLRDAAGEARQAIAALSAAQELGTPWDGSDGTPWQERLRLAEQQARQDPLTGLLNRRGLSEAVAALSMPEYGRTLAVAMLDLDHFKAVNDRHSHAAGDEVLRRTARLLEAELPPGAQLCRHGGEEFVLVVPLGAAPAEATVTAAEPGGGAWALLERCRRAVETHEWAGLVPGTAVTVSAGYACGDAETFPALLRAADEQLYRAKRAGRNRVLPPAGASPDVTPD